MNNNHTPGPWQIKTIGDRIVVEGDRQNNPGYPQRVALVTQHWGRLKPESEANAKLIAAAPEMLELLRECLGTEDQAGFVDAPAQFDEAIRTLLSRIDDQD